MRLWVATEAHFRLASDVAFCESGTQDAAFWSRYLTVFDHVTVMARCVGDAWVGQEFVIGPGVSLYPLPDYRGPMQYVQQAGAIRRRLSRVSFEESAFLARVPGRIGSLVVAQLRRSGVPYGIEVVGDPYDAFAPSSSQHPLRILFRWASVHDLKRICGSAAVVGYVTEAALQCRYPANREAFTTHYSSVQLSGDAFASKPRSYTLTRQVHLVAVGRLGHMYKGADTALKTVRLLSDQGISTRLTWVGGGRYQREMQQLADRLGIADRVTFLGDLPPGESVRNILDSADLFVMPSRQEGLPRAMIEAMARGLPCIGSHVGGIPELLPAETLFPIDDHAAMADRIRELVLHPERMNQMSERNLAKAAEYRIEVLQRRREQLLRHLCEVTARYLSMREGSLA